MKLNSFTLQIFEPQKTLDFYTSVLGFSLLNEFSKDDSTYYNLGFKNPDFYIQLKYTSTLEKIAYQEVFTDNYWKYSLFVDNIQKAYQNLAQHNIPVGKPYQFEDIGYLSHTKDVENHNIELIQKTFKQNGILKTEESTAFGLLTLRTKDPVKIIHLYEDILEMKLFVRMYVNRGRGFTLYFLGDKNLQAPNSDIDAIDNREWMYQQSHLFVEIQHYWDSEHDDDFKLNSTDKNGLQTVNFSGDLGVLKEKLKTNDISFRQENNIITFETLDNYFILVKNCVQR